LYEGDRVKLASVGLNGGLTFPVTNVDPKHFYVRRRVDDRTIEVGVGKQAVSGIDPATNTYNTGGTVQFVNPTIPTSSISISPKTLLLDWSDRGDDPELNGGKRK